MQQLLTISARYSKQARLAALDVDSAWRPRHSALGDMAALSLKTHELPALECLAIVFFFAK
jgi:hypothetical protein